MPSSAVPVSQDARHGSGAPVSAVRCRVRYHPPAPPRDPMGRPTLGTPVVRSVHHRHHAHGPHGHLHHGHHHGHGAHRAPDRGHRAARWKVWSHPPVCAGSSSVSGAPPHCAGRVGFPHHHPTQTHWPNGSTSYLWSGVLGWCDRCERVCTVHVTSCYPLQAALRTPSPRCGFHLVADCAVVGARHSSKCSVGRHIDLSDDTAHVTHYRVCRTT